LALVIARRSRVYGGDGAVPRRIAWLALLVFLIAGVAVLVSIVAERRADSALILPEYARTPWRERTATILSIVGWVLAIFAAVWNGVLGVALRRRTAIQELKRRTDRVRDYRTPPSSPRP
jgi:predicted PurR-regulated permease PerM